jgi:YaiO family outer membrane protein
MRARLHDALRETTLIVFAAGCIVAAAAACTRGSEDDAGAGLPVEYYGGYYHLDMGAWGVGHNPYAGVRYRPRERSLLYVQSDYLDRFDKREARVLGGASTRVAGVWSLSGEIAVAPRAEIFPTAASWAELGRPVSRSLALSARVNGSAYRNARLFGASLGSEYYPQGDLALISRVALSTVDFGGAPASTDGSVLLKIIWFVDDRTRIFAYGAAGNESFIIETIDRTGNIRSNVVGIGGTFFPFPSIALSPSFEYQRRERGPRFLQFGFEASVAR